MSGKGGVLMKNLLTNSALRAVGLLVLATTCLGGTGCTDFISRLAGGSKVVDKGEGVERPHVGWLGARGVTSADNVSEEAHEALVVALKKLCDEAGNQEACRQHLRCKFANDCATGNEPVLILSDLSGEGGEGQPPMGVGQPTYCDPEHAHYFALLIKPESEAPNSSGFWHIRGYLRCIICGHEIKLGRYQLNDALSADEARSQAASRISDIIEWFKRESLSWPRNPTIN